MEFVVPAGKATLFTIVNQFDDGVTSEMTSVMSAADSLCLALVLLFGGMAAPFEHFNHGVR